MPFLFEKYDSLVKHANGRPVGVRNGQGQKPVTASNPALDGMKHTGGIAGQLQDAQGWKGIPRPAYNAQVRRESAYLKTPTENAPGLLETQGRAVKKQEQRLGRQVTPDKAIEVLTEWQNLFK